MQKMKNGKKVLSVCLSLAMAAGMLSRPDLSGVVGASVTTAL